MPLPVCAQPYVLVRTSQLTACEEVELHSYLVFSGGGEGTRKLPGAPCEQGVSSIRESWPTPARTIFFATCVKVTAFALLPRFWPQGETRKAARLCPTEQWWSGRIVQSRSSTAGEHLGCNPRAARNQYLRVVQPAIPVQTFSSLYLHATVACAKAEEAHMLGDPD